MGAFYMNEAMFDLPETGFSDRTVTFLEATSPSGGEAALVVERRPVPEGKTLREAAAEHVDESRKRLRGYTVLYEREAEVSEIPALEIGARFRDEGGAPVYCRQTHFIVGATWLIVAGEAPMTDKAFCDGYVEHVLGTLRLRD